MSCFFVQKVMTAETECSTEVVATPGSLYAIALEQYYGNLLLPQTFDSAEYWSDPQKVLISSDVLDVAAPADNGGALVIRADGTVWGGGVAFNNCAWSDPIFEYTFACGSRYYSEIPELGSGWTRFGKVSLNSYDLQPVFAVKSGQLYYWGTSDSSWYDSSISLFSSATPVTTPYSPDAEIWIDAYGWALVRDQGAFYFWSYYGGEDALGFGLLPNETLQGFQPYTPVLLTGLKSLVGLAYGSVAYLIGDGVYMSAPDSGNPKHVLVAEDVAFLAEGSDVSTELVVVKNNGSLWVCRFAQDLVYHPDPINAGGLGDYWMRLGSDAHHYVRAFCHKSSGYVVATTDTHELHVYVFNQVRYSGSPPYDQNPEIPAFTFQFEGPASRIVAQQYGFLVLVMPTAP